MVKFVPCATKLGLPLSKRSATSPHDGQRQREAIRGDRRSCRRSGPVRPRPPGGQDQLRIKSWPTANLSQVAVAALVISILAILVAGLSAFYARQRAAYTRLQATTAGTNDHDRQRHDSAVQVAFSS